MLKSEKSGKMGRRGRGESSEASNYVVPRGHEELIREISTRYEDFSPRLKQIARFVLNHPNEIALDTIATVALHSKVQPSSLIRFAKALGYSGYSEMQRIFRDRLVAAKPSYSQRIRELKGAQDNADFDDPHVVLQHFVAAHNEALKHMLAEVSTESLQEAVRLLRSAEHIHLLAMRRAFPVASYLFYALNNLGRRAFLIDNVGGMLSEQASWIGEKDVLVAVSYQDYSPEVVNLVERMHGKGVPIIAITDELLSPLVQLANVSFQVEDAAVHDFRSLGASLCLAQALVIALGHQMENNGGGG